MATVNTGGVTYTSNSKTPYVDIYNQWAKNQQAQINQHKADQQTQQNLDIGKVNTAYDSNAKQYYLQNMQAKKNLNSQLAQQGINGGASESAMLRMNTAYGQNVAKNEGGRASDTADIRNTYATNLANYLAEQEATRSNMYTTMMENQAKYAEQQRDKDLQNFANSVTNRFGSKSGYQKLIKQLKSSSDPLKNEKIALVQQAMNNWLLSNKGSSGGGGGGGRSYGGGYSSGYGGGGGGANNDNNGKPKSSTSYTVKGSKGVSKYSAVADLLSKNKKKKASGNYNFRYW